MTLERAREALREYFGYSDFRPMQAEIIEAVLEGRDALVLMPTGGGKSICYQIPALIRPGVAIVVSPLIALMKDQVEALTGNGIAAAFLNSSQGVAERRDVERKARNGELELLYVSPEKLLSQSFNEYMLRVLKVSLFAIDEAHCISAWGHDFRPEYTKLRFLKERFPNVPLIALTATADRTTRRDIIRQLFPTPPADFIASFDRPNISLTVLPAKGRFKHIQRFVLNRRGQSGIIYCLSRRQTESLAKKLTQAGLPAVFYHAGMNPETRAWTQEAFINDRSPVICATIAFGMGIDKSNVRWVIHYNMPKNIEGYYQEVGRAGRDGAPSEALLFYTFADVVTLRKIIEKGSRNDLQMAKLERMRQYADAPQCRRQILLSYFGEQIEACGNCDVCEDPPEPFDATVIAQKALSALARLPGEPINVRLLVDILRGSRRSRVTSRGYHRIKTFGAGRDLSEQDWHQYLLQLLNLGLLEIAYDQQHALRLNDAAVEVLKGGRPVMMVPPDAIARRAEQRTAATKERKSASGGKPIDPDLFDHLREIRADIAATQGKPAYLIFSDATLREMSAIKPTDRAALLDVSGVGKHKLKVYGKAFIDAIRAHDGP